MKTFLDDMALEGGGDPSSLDAGNASFLPQGNPQMPRVVNPQAFGTPKPQLFGQNPPASPFGGQVGGDGGLAEAYLLNELFTK